MFPILRAIPLFFLLMALASACQKPKPDPARTAEHRIDSLEKGMQAQMNQQMAGDSGNADSQLEQVLTLTKEYQLFVADYPKDSLTPKYILKEAQIFHGYLSDYEQASKVYASLIDSFPQAKERPLAFLLMANARHDAGDTASAQIVLKRAIKEYPNTEVAAQAQQLSAYIRNGLQIQDSTKPAL